jgi:hypothetical protein
MEVLMMCKRQACGSPSQDDPGALDTFIASMFGFEG